MSHNFILDSIFHLWLFAIDQELAESTKSKGCPHCGGQLDKAVYSRSPSGLPPSLREYYESRLSFCCANCRKRITPPSVRFFGRRWFPAPLFLFICLLQCGINERRLAQIKRHFGIRVSESTWKRWRRWWRESFCATPFWQAQNGLVAVTLKKNIVLPRALWHCFKGTLEERMFFLLRFLSPLTTNVFRTV